MFKQTFLAAFLSFVAANALTAPGIGAAMDRFSFDYAVHGDDRAKPLQVFDDGQKTYLQYRANGDIPVFISSRTAQLLIPRQEGPYTVLLGTPRDFIAQLGSARARLTHASQMSTAAQYQTDRVVRSVPSERVTVAALSPGAGGMALSQMAAQRNEWTDNSYATPAKGDRVTWASADVDQSKTLVFERGSATMEKDSERLLKQVASSMKGASRVVISTADDTHPSDAGGTARAQNIRKVLIASGVKPEVISVRVGFFFDDQLQKVGKRLMNPATVTWTEQTSTRPVAGLQAARRGEAELSVVDALRSGQISPAEALERLQAGRESRAVAAQPAVAASRQAGWTVRKADQTIEKMLERWASDSGWKVIWKGAPNVDITADAVRPLTHPDFLQAADYVVTQAKSAGYRIKATAYSNQILVVTGE